MTIKPKEYFYATSVIGRRPTEKLHVSPGHVKLAVLNTKGKRVPVHIYKWIKGEFVKIWETNNMYEFIKTSDKTLKEILDQLDWSIDNEPAS